ncbi:hypothetical protein CI109_107050 [Kwoniella shandongensis]|uniref:Uncharacterized protein n=1 Tax=Kwoniella shandongensis TaxID=1734106 RepID=A0A5M6BT22_9TREE|nr:uncharacterized protein CI109_006459 [Kwoniella shandongensis]KAA5525190.1 hypothetical protein CI109_006459 [Kwoniella shandongensis]
MSPSSAGTPNAGSESDRRRKEVGEGGGGGALLGVDYIRSSSTPVTKVVPHPPAYRTLNRHTAIMVLISLGILGLALMRGVPAQSSSTSTAAAVPTGTPISGDYTGAYRPRVHYTPPKGFMNDPNGLFLDPNGTWHLYYQYNPTDVVAGNQHWGHATSPDLYRWTNQPIALFPPNATSGVFSGSAVLDPNNTSGFFPNQTDGVVAMYTLNTPTAQVQEIAYSTDGGYTFTPYEGNPVIDIGSTQFRDPKVVRYQDHWVMVIAFASEWVIGVYTSPNLIDWTHASNISHIGLLGVQYECPNLVQVPVTGSGSTKESEGWVLTISINPGAPLGGSITEYFAGEFNGTHFEPYDGAARLSNFAKDDYAGQFFYDQPVSIGWASNWQYTNEVPTANEGWRSAMTLPRKNYLNNTGLGGYELVQEIYDLSPILGNNTIPQTNLVNSTASTTLPNVSALYFDANITIPANSTFNSNAVFNFTFATGTGGESVKGGYRFAGTPANTIWLDRGNTNGFDSPFLTDKFSASQVNRATRIQGVVDRSLIEVYVDGGAVVGTMVVFPTEPLVQFDFESRNLPEGPEISFAAWELVDTWA